MDQERFEKQLRFILEVDREKNILRQTHLSGGGRQENDAEHAWHMAVMAYLLREYANEPIDLAKTMMMIDLIEIFQIAEGRNLDSHTGCRFQNRCIFRNIHFSSINYQFYHSRTLPPLNTP